MINTLDASSAPHYVNFAPRLYASIIDTALSGILLFWPLVLVLKVIFPDGLPSEILAKFVLNQDHAGMMAYLQGAGGRDFLIEQIGPGLLWGAVIVIFWHYRAATPGKMLLKMRIVDAKTLEEPSTGQYIKRFFGYIFSTLPLFLGFFWVKWDKRRQGFHDKIAGTVVIKVE